MGKFLKNNWVLLLIIALGIFFRIYNYKELFLYGHDQDLGGWFVKDVVVNHHFRLIGQLTSTEGIFIGPIFYYLLVPFYWTFGMSPIGGVFLVLIIGIFVIWSFYFVFLKLFDKKTGLVASLIYSLSFYTIFNDREVVPTMPVILWSVWFLWALYLVLKGKQKMAYVLLGILLALTWHLNVALVLLVPLILLASILSKKKLDLHSALLGLTTFTVFSLPFFLFEIRHGFVQIRSVIAAFTTNQNDVVSGMEKVTRTFLLFSKDLHNLLWGNYGSWPYGFDLFVFGVIFGVVIYKKIIPRKLALIFLSWIFVYILFFSLYSKRLSEYYLNGVIVILIGTLSISTSHLLKLRSKRILGFALITLFALINFLRFSNITINRSGFVERTDLINEILKDSNERGYPCVSISYITDPGYDRGYRYLFWWAGLKTKPISRNVPVYTIVFPLKPIFPTDKTYGAIGLIYPKYSDLDPAIVEESCRGDDFNLTNPMIGMPE